MNTAPTVCYLSLADKARRYVAETIPLVFAQAVNGMAASVTPAPSLAAIHDTIRRGVYVKEDGPCDEVRPVTQTLADGGDCEDWAAVLLSWLMAAGVAALLVTAGDKDDNFRHVYVLAADNTGWHVLDPKGSQKGLPFGREADFAVRRYWQMQAGLVVEVSLPRGSGADVSDADIAAMSDEARTQYFALHPGEQLEYQRRQAAANPTLPPVPRDAFKTRQGLIDHLKAGEAAKEAAQAAYSQGKSVTEINAAAQKAAAAVLATAQAAKPVAATAVIPLPMRPQTELEKLTTDNDAVASWFAAGLPSDGLRKVAAAFEMDLARQDGELRQAVAEYVSLLATSQRKALREAFAAKGVAVPAGSKGTAPRLLGSAGFFDKLGKSVTKLVKRPADFFQSATEEIGKGIGGVGKAVLKLEDKAPWLGQFFTKPLGFHAQAVALEQVGRVLIDHDVNAFDEKALTRAAAATFRTAGQALVTASPFLPAPWNVAAAAVGALSLAAGKAIDAGLDSRELAKKLEKDANYGAEVITLDQYGRRIDAQGNLLDPAARLVEQRRASETLQTGQSSQTAQATAAATSGWSYYWTDFGDGVARVAAYDAAPEQGGVARWVWVTDQGWVEVRY